MDENWNQDYSLVWGKYFEIMWANIEGSHNFAEINTDLGILVLIKAFKEVLY